MSYLVRLLILALVLAIPASAQNTGPPSLQYWWNGSNWVPVSAANPEPVNATVTATASISGFKPTPAYTFLTATVASSASTALPSNTGTVNLYNTSTTTPVSCTVASGAATATANMDIIQPGSTVQYTVTGFNNAACIDQTGSASSVVVLSGGSGLFAGSGGGGGGGSGGNVTVVGPLGSQASTAGVSVTIAPDQAAVAVKQATAANLNATVVGTGTFAVQDSIADGSDVTLGAIADAAAAAGGTGTISAKLRETTGLLNTGNTSAAATAAAIGTTADSPCTAPTTSTACTDTAILKLIANLANSSIPAGTNTIGGTTPVAAATGGATGGTILSAASNNSTSIKASAGTLYSVSWLQTTTTLMDIRFYDTASAPTCSSATSMKLNFVAQSNATSPGATISLGPAGIAFTSGIGVCITGANANNDNSNAAVGLNLIYGFN